MSKSPNPPLPTRRCCVVPPPKTKNNALFTYRKRKTKKERKKHRMTRPTPRKEGVHAPFLRPPAELLRKTQHLLRGGSREYNRQGAEGKSFPFTQHPLERGGPRKKRKQISTRKRNRTEHHDGRLPHDVTAAEHKKHMPFPRTPSPCMVKTRFM